MFERITPVAALVILIVTLVHVVYELSDKISRNWGEALNEMLPQSIVISTCLITLTFCRSGSR